MGQWHNTRTDDVVDVPDALDNMYKEKADWEPHKAPKAKASTGSN
jgi:hypothetical protein